MCRVDRRESNNTVTPEKKKIKAAFVYVSPVRDAGWTYTHDKGRQFIKKKYGIKTAYAENVAEGGDDERGVSVKRLLVL